MIDTEKRVFDLFLEKIKDKIPKKTIENLKKVEDLTKDLTKERIKELILEASNEWHKN